MNQSATPLLLGRYLLHWASTRPSEICWLDEFGPITWGQFASNVFYASQAIDWLEHGPLKRIAIWLPNGRCWVESMLAIHLLGAVDVPLDARLTQAQAIDLSRRSGCGWLLTLDNDQLIAIKITTQADDPKIEHNLSIELKPCLSPQQLFHWDCNVGRISPWQTACIQWTSGTTGNPKGVMLSHYNLTSNAIGKWQAVPQQPNQVRLAMLSLAHAYARTSDFGTWLVSGGVLSAVEGTDAFFAAAQIVKPHLVNTVPYVIHAARKIANNRSVRDVMGGRLQWLGCGGAALPVEEYRQLMSEGISVVQGYGLTEASPVVCSATPDNGRPGFVGQPIAGVTLRIDEFGEVWCQSPGIMQGYLDDPIATDARIDNGWLRTGDLGEFADDGQLRVIGRADDVIVLATGHKVHPSVIEQCLMSADEIDQVVVTLSADRQLTALIFPANDQFREGEMLTVCHRCLAARQSHEQIRKVRILPRRLSAANGELTVKGTIRRGVVLHRVVSSLTV